MPPNETIQMMTNAQVLEPKSTTGIYTLPCGYLDVDGTLHTEVVVNEISGREEDMLTSKKTANQKKFSQLLLSCVSRVGPYTDREKIAAIIPELLVGDRVFLLIAIRRVSLGDDYPYKDKCPSCEKESLMSINLSELETTPMADPKKRVYETRMPSKAAIREWAEHGEVSPTEKLNPQGHAVQFRCVVGRDEERLGLISESADALSKALQTRIQLLDGKAPSVQDLQSLSLSERQFLRDVVFDKVDGGVETSLEVSCPQCGFEYGRDLDLGQMGFFFPSAARKNSKTRSST